MTTKLKLVHDEPVVTDPLPEAIRAEAEAMPVFAGAADQRAAEFLSALGAEALAFADRRARAHAEFWSLMATCWDPVGIVDHQLAFSREAMEAWTEEFERCAELYTETFSPPLAA